jgi:hypothetical protein
VNGGVSALKGNHVIHAAWNGPAGQKLEFRRHFEEISYQSDLDRNWVFTDIAGHRHHCDYSGPDHYPTLLEVRDENHWCGDCLGEYQPLIRRECRQCGEEIHVGITGPGVTQIPVWQEWTLTETLTGDEAIRATRDLDGVEADGNTITVRDDADFRVSTGPDGLHVTWTRSISSEEADALIRSWSTP